MLIKRNPTPGLLAASRANGALSSGPASVAGKSASALAPLRHGLYSAAAVLPTESHPEFVTLREGLLDELCPRNLAEAHLTEQIASALWCIQRAQIAESEIVTARLHELFPAVTHYTFDHLALAFSHLSDSSGILHHIGRFEFRHQRRFDRALDRLGLMQASQPAEEIKIAIDPVNIFKTQESQSQKQPVPREPEPSISAAQPSVEGPPSRLPHASRESGGVSSEAYKVLREASKTAGNAVQTIGEPRVATVGG